MAPRPEPTMIAVGVASPSASGQVITTTVIANSSDCSTSRPTNAPPDEERDRPAIRATRTSQNAARSASRWPGALEFCACWTSSTICASAVSEPIAVARARSVPFSLIVAPMTPSPGPLCTGRLSPGDRRLVDVGVALDTSASTGTFAPGRISSRSPTATSAVGTSTAHRRAARPPCGGARSSSVADRVVGAAAGTHLKPVPEQHERRQHRRRVVEHVSPERPAVTAAE